MKKTIVMMLLVVSTTIVRAQTKVFDGNDLGIGDEPELLGIVHDSEFFVVMAKGKNEKNQRRVVLALIHPERKVVSSYIIPSGVVSQKIYHAYTKDAITVYFFLTFKSSIKLHGVKFFKSGQPPEPFDAADNFRKLKEKSIVFNHQGQLKLLIAENKDKTLKQKVFTENGDIVDQGTFSVSKEVLESVKDGFHVSYPEQINYDNSMTDARAYVYSDSIILLRNSTEKPFRSDFCVLNFKTGKSTERSLIIGDTARQYSVAFSGNKIFTATLRSRVFKSKTIKTMTVNVFDYGTLARSQGMAVPLEATQVSILKTPFTDYERSYFGDVLEVENQEKDKTIKEVVRDHSLFIGIESLGGGQHLFQFGAIFYPTQTTYTGPSGGSSSVVVGETIRMASGCVTESLKPCPLDNVRKSVKARELEFLTKNASSISEWILLPLDNASHLAVQGHKARGFSIYSLD